MRLEFAAVLTGIDIYLFVFLKYIFLLLEDKYLFIFVIL